MTRAVETIVIVGRDAPLWLAASVIRAALRPAAIAVAAIELPSALDAADVYATMPGIEALHSRLGLVEADLLRAAGGAYSLGQNYVDPRGPLPFLNAYGDYGTQIDGIPFFGYWVKARAFGLPVGLEDFSLTAAAARQGRVMIPDDASDSYARADYGYHLPARAYAAGLKLLAARLGVRIVEARAIGVTRRADGAIAAIEADGEAIGGDLFIDATGAGADLAGGLSATGCESWRGVIPADRLLVARGGAFEPIPTYAECRMSDHGWTGLYPAQAATHVLHCYSSATCGDEEALRAASAASGFRLSDAVVRTSDPGRREEAWTYNCIALGAAACALDPVHNLDLHAVQLGLVQLLRLLPASPDARAERAEYNGVMRSAFERLRDYQAAFYALAPYAGPFWEAARAAPPPAGLAHIVATFRARGEIVSLEDDSIPPDNWRALLIGLGLVPESWPPRVDLAPPDLLKAHFRQMLGVVKEVVLRQPIHAAALHHPEPAIFRSVPSKEF